MGVAVPRSIVTKRICDAVRAGLPLERAARAAGVDVSTLQDWIQRGLDVEADVRDVDPFAIFAGTLREALDDAEDACFERSSDHTSPFGRESEASRPPVDEPKGSDRSRAPRCPPLAWLVVEEAPIEIVIGSRPVWVYESEPQPSTMSRVERPSFHAPPPAIRADAWDKPNDIEPDPVGDERPSNRDRPIAVMIMATIVVSLVAVVAIALAVVVVAIALAGVALIGPTRLAIGLMYRWRAGLLALRGGGAIGFPYPVGSTWCRLSRAVSPGRSVPPPDRMLGAASLTGRSRPQRE